MRDANNVSHNASGSIVPNNTWQHLVGVCDEPNNAVILYVNGVNNVSTTIANGVQMGTTPISIGCRQLDFRGAYTLNFIGSIDEVAIYGHVLSPAQILNHYMTGTNPVVSLYLQRSGNNNVLLWSPGTLQSSLTVNGLYTNVPSAVSPYTLSPTDAARFYRVKVR